jgi:uncharacterized protein (DUF736 family)
MTDYDDTDKGALFKNDDKQGDKSPDYRGELNVGGTEYWLSAWLRTSKKSDRKYFSLAVKPKEQRQRSAGPGGARPSLKDELADEIPF